MEKREQPKIFNPAAAASWRAFGRLRSGLRKPGIVDTYAGQLAELALVEQPGLIRLPKEKIAEAVGAFIAGRTRRGPLIRQGRWVHYPWLNTLVHVLAEPEFNRVRTSRNANLITFAEQKKFYDTVVGVAGLSVGSNVALSVVLAGGARRIRLADFDELELSNTNRLIAGVHQLGLPKTTVIARRIWEINPYAHVGIFDRGLNATNVASFMRGLDVVVDEMDDFVIKQRLRELARKQRIPLLSAADNGDRSTIDVERHDLGRTPYFLGRLGTTDVARFSALRGNKQETIRTIARLIGAEHHPVRMIRSLPAIGETLVSVPQLGGTALIGASAVTYLIRGIVAGDAMPSGRYHLCLDENLDPGYSSDIAVRERKRLADMLKTKLGI
ncbi:MAG TPA: ThiF family adenylyltransferase [Candidatus Paceibacterota bacterium]|nr:ThiF family adenylyltransferase [Candidatus Paceibacterota bacterium]